MKPWEMFNFIKETHFATSGDHVDWAVIVHDNDKTVYLVFEESNGRRDWINNLRFPVKIYKKQESVMRCACGWGNAWKSCNDEVMKMFIQACDEHKEYTPHICGWSYGGAISLLAAEDFHYRTGRKAAVTTFGAPKPLWGKKTKDYVKSCTGVVHQYQHVNDCVPLMPPLPGYCLVWPDKIGKGFSLIKLFKPTIYHCIYGDERLYD